MTRSEEQDSEQEHSLQQVEQDIDTQYPKSILGTGSQKSVQHKENHGTQNLKEVEELLKNVLGEGTFSDGEPESLFGNSFDQNTNTAGTNEEDVNSIYMKNQIPSAADFLSLFPAFKELQSKRQGLGQILRDLDEMLVAVAGNHDQIMHAMTAIQGEAVKIQEAYTSSKKHTASLKRARSLLHAALEIEDGVQRAEKALYGNITGGKQLSDSEVGELDQSSQLGQSRPATINYVCENGGSIANLEDEHDRDLVGRSDVVNIDQEPRDPLYRLQIGAISASRLVNVTDAGYKPEKLKNVHSQVHSAAVQDSAEIIPVPSQQRPEKSSREADRSSLTNAESFVERTPNEENLIDLSKHSGDTDVRDHSIDMIENILISPYIVSDTQLPDGDGLRAFLKNNAVAWRSRHATEVVFVGSHFPRYKHHSLVKTSLTDRTLSASDLLQKCRRRDLEAVLPANWNGASLEIPPYIFDKTGEIPLGQMILYWMLGAVQNSWAELARTISYGNLQGKIKLSEQKIQDIFRWSRKIWFLPQVERFRPLDPRSYIADAADSESAAARAALPTRSIDTEAGLMASNFKLKEASRLRAHSLPPPRRVIQRIMRIYNLQNKVEAETTSQSEKAAQDRLKQEAPL